MLTSVSTLDILENPLLKQMMAMKAADGVVRHPINDETDGTVGNGGDGRNENGGGVHGRALHSYTYSLDEVSQAAGR